MPADPPPDPMAVLLHLGGHTAQWGNLGLWPAGADDGQDGDADYASACRALALAVGQAARLQPGDRVLSLACGAGEELRLWAAHFGAVRVLGIERDPRAAACAQALCADDPRIQLQCRPALPLHPALAGAAHDRFDAIVCVDAAYHLSPRHDLLSAARRHLRPGGRLAYADLTLRGRASPLLRAAARLCGVPATDLLPLPAQVRRLRSLGFVDVQAQALDEAVLGGFVRFVRRQAAAQGLRPWQTGWRTVATTAALIPPCRAAGLGYALLAATWPGSPAAGDGMASSGASAPSRSATA